MRVANALCALLLICSMSLGRAQTISPLEKQVSPAFTHDSFNGALKEIEARTGLEIACPKEVSATMETIWARRGFPTVHDNLPDDAKVSVKAFLDGACWELGLAWKFQPESNRVAIDYLWRTSDPRPEPELLQFVWKPGYGTDFEKDERWQKAFNALLCKPGNLEKASLVRQRANYESVANHMGNPAGCSVNPVLRVPIVDTVGEKYVFILISHRIFMYPGHGSVSYYWFKENGILAGAGLMNTGHRCALVDTVVNNEYGARSGETSEVHMILKVNVASFLIARFVLEPEGLKLISLVDAEGQRVDNDHRYVGKSLIDVKN